MNTRTILRDLRKERGITQRVVADYLKVSIATLSNYESGIHHPPLSVLLKLCDFYGVSADYLLGRTDSRIGANYFNHVLMHEYTVGDCVELLIGMKSEHIKHFIEYLELTQPSFKKKKERTLGKTPEE